MQGRSFDLESLNVILFLFIIQVNGRNNLFSIKFFDEDNTLLFELKEVKEKDFKIDKTNFYHAGWFKFELYEGEKLLEKHKFYLEKDF